MISTLGITKIAANPVISRRLFAQIAPMVSLGTRHSTSALFRVHSSPKAFMAHPLPSSGVRQFSISTTKWNKLQGTHETGKNFQKGHQDLTKFSPPPQNFASSASPLNHHTSIKNTVTKATLLSQANNAFSRFLVHIKWPLHRGTRNTSLSDVISAFISSVVMGNLLWIILGTTTFGLMTMYSIHYFDNLWYKIFPHGDDDEEEEKSRRTTDRSILGYLTSSVLAHGLGVTIEFQRGHILPEFKDGKLRFKNFKVNSPAIQSGGDTYVGEFNFSAKIEAMDITLSFNKWYEGNGIINEIEIFGLNGEVFKVPESEKSQVPLVKEPKQIKEQYQSDLNDYHIESFPSIPAESKGKSLLDSSYQLEQVKIRDSYFEIFEDSEKSSKPLRVTIFSCDLPRLRGDRVLIDFFNANNVSGALNDSMFTIHKRQSNFAGEENDANNKIVRMKINGIDIGSVSRSNPSSKFNWLVNGKAEITADITIPNINEDEFQFANEYKRIGSAISEIISNFVSDTIPESENKSRNETPEDNTLLKGALAAIYHTFTKPVVDETHTAKSDYVLVNVKIKFTELQASLPQQLPLSSTGIPFISLQNLRSLIACVNTLFTGSPTIDTTASSSASGSPSTVFNAHNPLVIKTTVIEKITDLYNIENLAQTSIVDSIISDVYEDLLKLVKSNEQKIISEKSNMWSHSIASQLLLLGLGVIV